MKPRSPKTGRKAGMEKMADEVTASFCGLRHTFPSAKMGCPTAEAGAFKLPSDVFHVLVSLTFSGQRLNIFFPSFLFPKMLAVPFSSELAIYNVDFGQSGGRWKKKKKKKTFIPQN